MGDSSEEPAAAGAVADAPEETVNPKKDEIEGPPSSAATKEAAAPAENDPSAEEVDAVKKQDLPAAEEQEAAPEDTAASQSETVVEQPAVKPKTSKKRKLSNAVPPPTAAPATARPPSTTMTPHTPLADPAVVRTVHDIIGLLQTYGPLSYAQLEYNLPPMASLQHVLQVMVTMGVVQVTEDARYAMLKGIPRADVVLPQTVLDDILQAQLEVKQSKERSAILKEALLAKHTNPRDVLKQVLWDYPEVAQDPIYLAALRSVHVDVTSVERERVKQEWMSSRQAEEQDDKEVLSTDNVAKTSPPVEKEKEAENVESKSSETKKEQVVEDGKEGNPQSQSS